MAKEAGCSETAQLAIFRRDGETLHACWSYTTTRPTEFKNEGNNFRFTFKRVKK